MLRVVVWSCWILFSVGLLSAENRPSTLAIPPFQEIGDLPAGCGSELALSVAQAIDPGRYEVKLRIHIKPLLQENMWDKPERLRAVLQNLEAQQFLLGTVCKTSGDYEVCYFVVDRLGNVLLPRDRVCASSWSELKRRLRVSLAGQTLAPPPVSTPLADNPWWWPAVAAAILLLGVGLFALARAVRQGRQKESLRRWQQCTEGLRVCQEQLARRLSLGTQDRELADAAQQITTCLMRLQAMSQHEVASEASRWRQLARLLCTLQQACIADPPARAQMIHALERLHNFC